MMEFVSWDDDDIPNMMGKSQNSMVPNHQPVMVILLGMMMINPLEWLSYGYLVGGHDD